MLIGLDSFFRHYPTMVSGSAEKLGEKDKPSHQGKTGPGEEWGNGKEGLNKVKIKERERDGGRKR